ncbi:MAG: LysM peptidoglycan-binding domain-containing M23 family metallopeptidase [Deltaproteobacteria bacterium]|nr:LysM peptidoglycan-binding domain-containing M23 family metallopeptidase [Deltaproteobacteria bacterium]
MVKKDETLWSISRAYNVDQEIIMKANDLNRPEDLATGRAIFIPDALRVMPAAAAKPPPSPSPTSPVDSSTVQPQPVPERESREIVSDLDDNAPPALPEDFSKIPVPILRKLEKPSQSAVSAMEHKEPSTKKTAEISRKEERTKQDVKQGKSMPRKSSVSKPDFQWPLRGPVIATYGLQKDGTRNNGIKIEAKGNTPVAASEEGIVTFSAWNKILGNTIVLQHGGEYSSLYAYLKRRNVKVGEKVKKRQTIGLSGRPRGGAQDCLLFGIYYRNKPRNPIDYLAAPKR